VSRSEPILHLCTVGGQLALDFNPALGDDPELRSRLLHACARTEIYLMAVGSFDDLVLRHDLRRAAIREFAAKNANLSGWELRWTALRARLALYVFRDGLTSRGSAEVNGADERLRALADQLQAAPAGA
jgi:hypothetical protein